MDPIAFIITIPIRDTELEDIKSAFLQKRPYNAPIPVDTVLDNAGNVISNPITKENYIEDCIAYFVLETTKNYLVEKDAKAAKDTETTNMNAVVSDFVSWTRS
jgi:hypothetical protein